MGIEEAKAQAQKAVATVKKNPAMPTSETLVAQVKGLAVRVQSSDLQASAGDYSDDKIVTERTKEVTALARQLSSNDLAKAREQLDAEVLELASSGKKAEAKYLQSTSRMVSEVIGEKDAAAQKGNPSQQRGGRS